MSTSRFWLLQDSARGRKNDIGHDWYIRIKILSKSCAHSLQGKVGYLKILSYKHTANKWVLVFGQPSLSFHYTSVWFTAQMFHIRVLWLRLKTNTGRIGAGVPSNESKTRLSGRPSLIRTLHSRGKTRCHSCRATSASSIFTSAFSTSLVHRASRPAPLWSHCRIQERCRVCAYTNKRSMISCIG